MQTKSPWQTGKTGEELAQKYLRSRGCQIVETNFRIQGGEIDIIAEHSSRLIFVEVKTRTSEDFGSGEESIGTRKRDSIRRAMGRYLTKNGLGEDADVQFDTIDLVLDPTTGELKTIHHLEDIEL